MDPIALMPDLDIAGLITAVVLAGSSYVLALPIGWDRERAVRSAGLRTFPLVAMASCGYLLLVQGFSGGDPNAEARVLSGLVTGIGFIGGGAILKHGSAVYGTATAASIWATAAVGAAVAYQRFEIAITLSTITWLTLRIVTPMKEYIDDKDRDGEQRPADG